MLRVEVGMIGLLGQWWLVPASPVRPEHLLRSRFARPRPLRGAKGRNIPPDHPPHVRGMVAGFSVVGIVCAHVCDDHVGRGKGEMNDD